MIRRWLLCLAAVAVLSAHGGSEGRDALPGIVGKDDRVVLDTAAWPWIAIGRINRAGGGFCTGSLVAADVVLTAAHCFYDTRSRRTIGAGEIHFVAGYRRGDYLAHAIARRIVTSPTLRFDPRGGIGEPSDDWALVVLDRPMAIRPIPVRRLRPTPHSEQDRAWPTVMVAGYSRDRPHLLSLHQECAIADRVSSDRIVIHSCDATHGTSGAPLLTGTAEEVFIVGVVTGVIRILGDQRGTAVDAGAFQDAVRRLRASAPSAD
ncbi:MAG: trypsin-like serine peptidase [Rhodospirillales bacterium]